jgi:hypothetical protein
MLPSRLIPKGSKQSEGMKKGNNGAKKGGKKGNVKVVSSPQVRCEPKNNLVSPSSRSTEFGNG